VTVARNKGAVEKAAERPGVAGPVTRAGAGDRAWGRPEAPRTVGMEAGEDVGLTAGWTAGDLRRPDATECRGL